MENINEDGVSVIGNSVGSGNIAGIGIESPSLSNQAEPGVDKKRKRKVVPFKEFIKRK